MCRDRLRVFLSHWFPVSALVVWMLPLCSAFSLCLNKFSSKLSYIFSDQSPSSSPTFLDPTLNVVSLNLPVKVITSTLKVFFKLLPDPLIDDTAVTKMLDFYGRYIDITM